MPRLHFAPLSLTSWLPFGIVLLLWSIFGTRAWRILFGNRRRYCRQQRRHHPHRSARVEPNTSLDAHLRHLQRIPALPRSRGLPQPHQPEHSMARVCPLHIGSAWALWYFAAPTASMGLDRARQPADARLHPRCALLLAITISPLRSPLCSTEPAAPVSPRQCRLGLLYLILDIQPILSPEPETALYLWAAPAWLAWYLWQRHIEQRHPASNTMEHALPAA